MMAHLCECDSERSCCSGTFIPVKHFQVWKTLEGLRERPNLPVFDRGSFNENPAVFAGLP